MTTTEILPTTFRLMGVNGDADTCSLCGRSGLVRVAWLAPVDADGNVDGEAVPYGTDCAGRLLHGRKCAGNTKLVRSLGEKLERVRRRLAAGMAAGEVCKRWGYETCQHAEPIDGGVRVYYGQTGYEVRP